MAKCTLASFSKKGEGRDPRKTASKSTFSEQPWLAVCTGNLYRNRSPSSSVFSYFVSAFHRRGQHNEGRKRTRVAIDCPHVGFLSFGHWTLSSQSQTRSAADTLLHPSTWPLPPRNWARTGPIFESITSPASCLAFPAPGGCKKHGFRSRPYQTPEHRTSLRNTPRHRGSCKASVGEIRSSRKLRSLNFLLTSAGIEPGIGCSNQRGISASRQDERLVNGKFGHSRYIGNGSSLSP
jgi:hypothetical protein